MRRILGTYSKIPLLLRRNVAFYGTFYVKYIISKNFRDYVVFRVGCFQIPFRFFSGSVREESPKILKRRHGTFKEFS